MLNYKGTTAPRAAAIAYAAIALAPVNDEPACFGHQDRQPRPAPRAPLAAYQVSASFVEPETVSTVDGFIAQLARGAPRAANEAYYVPARATAQFDPGIPASSGYIDSQPRHAPRGGNRAEQPQQRATWLEPGVPPGRGVIDDQIRQVPRASREAYSTPLLRPWDNQPAAFGWITHSAPGKPRAAQQAYWVEHKQGIEGSDKPAADGYQASRQTPSPRAALDAYQIITPLVRDEPEIGRQFVESASRTAPRAAASAYFVDQRAGIALPGAPVSLGHVSEPLAFLRAPSDVFLVTVFHPVIELPAARGTIDSVPKRRLPAAPEAYVVPARSMAGEVGVPAQFGFVADRAPAASRAASSAYIVSAAAVIADPPVAGKVLTPERAPQSPRAASEAYFRQTFAQISEPMPAGALAITGLAPGVIRASAIAYQTQISPQPLEVYPPALGSISQPAFAYRGQASQIVTAHLVEEVPAAKGYIETASRTAQRAASIAYAPPQRADIAGASAPTSTGYIEPTAHKAQRASATAYQIVPLPDVAGTDQPPTRGYVESARRQPRAASVAYAVPLRADLAGESAPASYGFQERQPLRVMRAASAVYLVAQSFISPEITYAGTRVYVHGESSAALNVAGGASQPRGVFGDDGARGIDA